MKKIKIILLTILPFVLFGQLDKDFNTAGENGFSGVLLMAKKGKVTFENAVGKRSYEADIPLKTSDVFELASVSKQFTAMMVMICKEKGLLAFDDSVNKYLEIPYSNINIRNLLTHTSGLPDYQEIMDKNWDKSRVAGNPDILEYLNRFAPPILFNPGDRYEYSNTGYVLLASIVEKVTGQDFVKLSKEWIFLPLKMEDTAIRTLEEKAALNRLAVGHLEGVNANRFHSSDYTVWLGNRKGPGRVSSTARDLLKWDQGLYKNKLVSKETLKEAYTPFILNDGKESPYGFGWNLEKDGVVWHNGDNPGYKTLIVRAPAQKKTYILLNNNAHPENERLVQRIFIDTTLPNR